MDTYLFDCLVFDSVDRRNDRGNAADRIAVDIVGLEAVGGVCQARVPPDT